MGKKELSDTPLTEAIYLTCSPGDESDFERMAKHAVEMERDRAELFQELWNIASARPETWDESVRDQFREWAQSRARHALKATGDSHE